MIELHTCRFCHNRGQRTFKYGVRHWACATCLALRYGTIEALERILSHSPPGTRKAFKSALRANCWSDWIRARIAVKDAAIHRAAARAKATVR